MLSLSDRQSHLNAMGISQWYARSPLLGAAVTPEFLLDVLQERAPNHDELYDHGLVVEPQAVVLDSARELDALSALDVLKQGGLTSTEEPVAKPLPVENVEIIKPESEVKLLDMASLPSLQAFSLVIYRSSKGLVISESEGEESHPSELVLLRNILKSKQALQASMAGIQYAQTFHWPVFHSLNLQSKQELLLSHILSEWFTAQSSPENQLLLYFGSSHPALSSFFKSMVENASLDRRFVSYTRSLSDMLRIPSRKSDVWMEMCEQFG